MARGGCVGGGGQRRGLTRGVVGAAEMRRVVAARRKRWRSDERQRRGDRGIARVVGAPVAWCPRAGGGLDGSGASLRQWWIGRQLMANENPARL